MEPDFPTAFLRSLKSTKTFVGDGEDDGGEWRGAGEGELEKAKFVLDMISETGFFGNEAECSALIDSTVLKERVLEPLSSDSSILSFLEAPEDSLSLEALVEDLFEEWECTEGWPEEGSARLIESPPPERVGDWRPSDAFKPDPF